MALAITQKQQKEIEVQHFMYLNFDFLNAERSARALKFNILCI